MTRSVPSSRWSSGSSRPAMRLEEGGALVRVEVADRAAEEGDQPRPGLARGRRALEVGLEVADQPVDVEPGVLLDQRRGGFAGDLLGDVDRDVGAQGARVAHRVEQVAGLRGRAGAELDQRRRVARGGDDLGRALDQDLALAAGRVVLLELGDRLEELRAALVVEVLRRELLRRPAPGPRARRAPSPRPGRRAGGRRSRSSSGVPRRGGCRRRSGGAAAGPSCGSSAGRRAGGSPRRRRAAPCSSSPKKTSEYSS